VPEGKTDWKRLREITDQEIDEAALTDPDAPPTAFDYWQDATPVSPPHKQRVTLHLDPEVVDFFRRQGRGYRERMNAVLQAYVASQKRRTG
jgi:uncharacterized protein (DUF4415 family)